MSIDKIKTNKMLWVITITLIMVFSVFLLLFNDIDKVQLSDKSGTSYEKAIVEEIISDGTQGSSAGTGYQNIKAKILTGKYKGEIVDATSFDGYLYGAECKPNMKVILSISEYNNQIEASVYSYNREPIIYAFVALFLLMLWIIGGKKGLKSAIGLLFTFICIMFLFIPMIYNGYSPFYSAVIVVSLITIVSITLIAGVNIKSFSAIAGTIAGVIIAGVSAVIFGHFAKISSYNVSEIESLTFVATQTNLKIGGLLFAGILIASLGAVMDVSMSIASTINEIYEQNPTLSKTQLFKSGINVGRDMMGTMSNTLILAFTGGALNTLILNYAYAMRYNQLINMYSIGIEIMQGVAGSLGIILTVPLVSFISSNLLTKGNTIK